MGLITASFFRDSHKARFRLSCEPSRKRSLFFVLAAASLAVLALSPFSRAAAAAFGVNLELPENNANAVEGPIKFSFNASGKPPMQCELLFNNATVAANITAYRNLPVSVQANPSPGALRWSVRCVDADGASAESEARALDVKTLEGEGGGEEAPKTQNTGVLSGFVVTQGAEREEGESALVASWRANVGRKVVLAALFSNEGSNALNVSMKVTLSQGENAVGSLESSATEVKPGEKRVLQVEWTPASEGAFEAQASAATPDGIEFQRAFLRLDVVQPPNIDWFFLLLLVCVTVLALALFKARLNAKAIKGGSLK